MSVAMDSNTKEIYIELLDEGTRVYRPTMGISLGDGKFKVMPSKDYDPDDENWAFLPGAIVRCKETPLNGGLVLLACELAG